MKFKKTLPIFILFAFFSFIFCTVPITTVPVDGGDPDTGCGPRCASCFNGFCNSCIGSWTPNGAGVCVLVSACPVDEYKMDGICTTCPSACSSCANEVGCTACNSGYLYLASCVPSCPSGTFVDGSQCTACYSGCDSCWATSSNACGSCQSGSFFYNNQCLGSCPAGTVVNGQNCETATSCPANCQDCSGSTCLTCNSGFYLLNNACNSDCPTGYYKNEGLRECESCVVNCDICSSSGCTQCKSGYTVSGGACIVTSCPTNCQTCSGSICTGCNNGFYLDNDACGTSCPTGTFKDDVNRKCSSCPGNCDTCSDASTCTGCSSSFYLYSGVCYGTCPPTTIKDDPNRKCLSCPSSCDTCSDTNTCTYCSSGYFLSGTQCAQACGTGKFGDASTRKCLGCPDDCDTCSDANTCTVCYDGYFKDNSLCVGTCPSKKYGDSATKECKDCSSNCNQCLSGTECQTCVSGWKLYQKACFDPCPDYAFTETSATCKDCSANCKICTSETTCSECGNSKVLYDNKCWDNCPAAHYVENGVCKPCEQGCTACNGLSQCTACDTKYFQDSGVCRNCKSECKTCSSLTVCQTCEPEFVFHASSCPSTCPMGTFVDSNKICQDCAPHCKDCTGLAACQACDNGYYLSNGMCLKCDDSCTTCTSATVCQQCEPAYVFYSQACPLNCPAGTWNSNQICEPCPIGCATCTTDKICQTCIFGYNLYTGTVCTINVNEEQAAQVEQVTKATEAAGTTSAAVGSVYGFLNSGDPSAMFMGTLAKMLQYVKYINIVYPPKITMMFEAADKVNKTEKSKSFIAKIEGNIKGAFYNAPLPGTFGHYQAHSSFASNFLQPLLTLGAIAFLIVVLEVLTRLTSKTSKVHKVLAAVLEIFKWNLFLIMFCGMYGDIIFYSSLEFRTSRFDDLTSTISFIICIAVNLLAVLVLARLIQVNLNLKSSRKNRVALNHQTKTMQDAVEKWKSYKPFFEAYKNFTFSQQSFMLFFIIRVSLFYSIIAYMQNSPKAQVILINLISLGIIVYLAIARPFTKMVNNLNQIVFECTVFAFNVCVLVLTFYDGNNASDFKKRESIGNVMMTINMIAGIVSMLFIVLKLLVLLRELYQDWRKSKRSKGTSVHRRSDKLEINVDNSMSASGPILTATSTLNNSQISMRSNTNSDLTISNLEQTTVETPYGRNMMPNNRLLPRPPQQQLGNQPINRMNYHPNSYQNQNQNVRPQVLRPEETIIPSMTSASSSRNPSNSIPESTESSFKNPSRKSSKIRKAKKKQRLQEELRKLEEKRQEQINMTRGMYSKEAKKLRRPAYNPNTFNE